MDVNFIREGGKYLQGQKKSLNSLWTVIHDD